MSRPLPLHGDDSTSWGRSDSRRSPGFSKQIRDCAPPRRLRKRNTCFNWRKSLAPLEHLQNPPQIDPTVAHLQGQLRQMQERQEMLLRAQNEQVQSAINSEIAAFREGKEHFEAVRNVMASLMESGRPKRCRKPMTWRSTPTRKRGQLRLESQRKEAERKAVEQQHAQRARTAAASVKGSTLPAVHPAPQGEASGLSLKRRLTTLNFQGALNGISEPLDIVATTIQNRSGKLADNVLYNNALLLRLNEKGNVRTVQRR